MNAMQLADDMIYKAKRLSDLHAEFYRLREAVTMDFGVAIGTRSGCGEFRGLGKMSAGCIRHAILARMSEISAEMVSLGADAPVMPTDGASD